MPTMAELRWSGAPHIPWPNVRGEARRRAVGATRKLGDVELEIVLEEIDRLGAPRVVLDLRDVADEDELVPSEYFSLGPQLQRALLERPGQPMLLYRLANDGVAAQLSTQFERQASRTGDGPAAPPILGLAELAGSPAILGALPGYLRPVFDLLAREGELTAADLNRHLGTQLATASDYLGELHRLRVAARQRETLPGGGTQFRYALSL
jgi:hypothetical protein